MSINHDQIFKTLIENFFREFMELFYPKLADEIDFSSVDFLREEIFTDLMRGEKRLLDLVVRVRLKNGERRVLLIHFEFESQRLAADFPRRIFEYYCVLFLRYGEQAVSIAILTDDGESKDPLPDVFDFRVDGDVGVLFKYHILKLSSIDYRQFLNSNNPLAFALMAKMKWSRRQIVRLKADFLRMILGTGIDPARQSLLVEFVETYMPLVEKQREEFLTLIQSDQAMTEVSKMVTTWELEGIKKGRVEGRQEGRVEGVQASLRRVLQTRFGLIPQFIEKKISQTSDDSVLEQMLKQAIVASSLDEFEQS